MNDVRMADGVVMANGTRMMGMTGFTTIDTPTQEDLYCEFEIDSDRNVTLFFHDGRLADQLSEMVLGGAFQGFEIKPKPARRRS